MTHPQTIDTDALRKLCEAADCYLDPGDGKLRKAKLFYNAARNALPAILNELDRLRAAEAAIKARVNPDADRYAAKFKCELPS